jgi:hypothetical protein
VRAHDYYLNGSPTSGADNAFPALQELPRSVRSLCEIVQGVLIHRDIASWLYGLTLSPADRDLANARTVAQMRVRVELGRENVETIAVDTGNQLHWRSLRWFPLVPHV